MKELLLIFSIPIVTAIICVVIHSAYKEDQKERLNHKKIQKQLENIRSADEDTAYDRIWR